MAAEQSFDQIIQEKIEAIKDIVATKEDVMITKHDIIDSINKAKT